MAAVRLGPGESGIPSCSCCIWKPRYRLVARRLPEAGKPIAIDRDVGRKRSR